MRQFICDHLHALFKVIAEHIPVTRVERSPNAGKESRKHGSDFSSHWGRLRIDLLLVRPHLRLRRESRLRRTQPSPKGRGIVGYCAVQPPSITSSLPVTKDDSSDAKYSTPKATSSASP